MKTSIEVDITIRNKLMEIKFSKGFTSVNEVIKALLSFSSQLNPVSKPIRRSKRK